MTNTNVFNEAAARAWLEGPDEEEPGYTMAESLGFNPDFTFESDDWAFALEDLVVKAAADPGLLPTGTLLWLTCSAEGLDGALVTRTYEHPGVKLCSSFLDFRDLVDDRNTTGIDNAVSVLSAIHGLASALALPGIDTVEGLDQTGDAGITDEELNDTLVNCSECGAELPTEEQCRHSEDGEHVPDMEIHEPPADDPTKQMRVDVVITVPNDGYDYRTDVGGRLERVVNHLLDDRLVTAVGTRGPSGSGWAADQDDLS